MKPQHRTRNILLIVGTLLTAILAVAVVVISTKLQKTGSKPVAPNVPESKPKAAIEKFCWTSFSITAAPADCIGKKAYVDEATNTAGKYTLTTGIQPGTTLFAGTTLVYNLQGKTGDEVSASNVIWNDQLDSRLEFVDGEKACTVAAKATATAGPLLVCDLGPLPPTTTHSTSFRVRLKTDATAGELINTAKLLQGETTVDQCALSLNTIQAGSAACVAKEAHTTYLSANSNETQTRLAAESGVTRGQEFVYRIYASIPTATQDSVVLTDTLPTQLEFVTSSLNSPANIKYDATTNKVTADFGPMQATENAKKIIAEFKVKVKDNASAAAFTNTASLKTGTANASTCALALTTSPVSCNNTCTTNSDCQSGLTCDTTSKSCRNASCTNEVGCVCQDSAFVIQKFEDINSNKSKDDGEKGLTWDFEWDLNGDNNWRAYQTYADQDGKGGRNGGLKENDVIRIKEKSKDGWSSTTDTTKELTLKKNETQTVQFGNKQKTAAGCNNSCVTSNDCSSGLTCSDGKCRNNSCVAKTNCSCDVATTTTTTTTTKATPTPKASPLPQAGSTGETIATIAVGAVIAVLGVIGLFAF